MRYEDLNTAADANFAGRVHFHSKETQGPQGATGATPLPPPTRVSVRGGGAVQVSSEWTGKTSEDEMCIQNGGGVPSLAQDGGTK